MSYRDETIALRERLLELEVKHAKLDGRVGGLRFRLNEAKGEREALRRRIELRGTTKKLARGASAMVATFVGIGLVIGCCVGSALLVHSCNAIDETLVVHRAYRGTERVEGCRIVIEEPFIDDCTAVVTCLGEGEVYRGTGSCQDGVHGTEFWNHGEPSFVVVTRMGRAVLRENGEALVFVF